MYFVDLLVSSSKYKKNNENIGRREKSWLKNFLLGEKLAEWVDQSIHWMKALK